MSHIGIRNRKPNVFKGIGVRMRRAPGVQDRRDHERARHETGGRGQVVWRSASPTYRRCCAAKFVNSPSSGSCEKITNRRREPPAPPKQVHCFQWWQAVPPAQRVSESFFHSSIASRAFGKANLRGFLWAEDNAFGLRGLAKVLVERGQRQPSALAPTPDTRRHTRLAYADWPGAWWRPGMAVRIRVPRRSATGPESSSVASRKAAS